MMIAKPTQLSGADFLVSRRTALLADAPRCGKTGTAIMAADMVGARRILVVTTASGRPVWRRGFADWSMIGHKTQILTGGDKLADDAEVVIVGWPQMADPARIMALWKRQWDVLILDEAHYAKSFEAKRTVAAFDPVGGLAFKADNVWCLSGTPMPNSPFDLFPMLKALAPERLEADGDRPDVSDIDVFKRRYCKIKPKKIGFHRWIDVIIGGQNLEELAARLDGFYLRRTQQDVGITAPIYEIMPLMASPAAVKRAQAAERTNVDAKVLAKIAAGDLDGLRDDHLGPVRRIWGELKVAPLVEAVKEEFEGGLDKVVIAAWHSDVIEALAAGLSEYGVVVVRGATNARHREEAVEKFNGKFRVFIGNIQAAGEAIDLSAAAELIFAESSFVPKDMAQMSLRITNHEQTRQPRVRVATLEGSIDDAMQASLMRKWATINEVMK